jgi:clathrin heavy chain
VNDAYNSILIDEEDYNTLRDSIDSFDRYDPMALAKKLEKHPVLEFRRLAAHLYKVQMPALTWLSFCWLGRVQKNARWETSIALSKEDKLFKDAIITAAASNSTEVVEDLLTYFVVIGNRECFAAMLYACFDLLRSDIIMDLSWQHGLNDFYMPYRIQQQRSMLDKVCALCLNHPNMLNSHEPR